MEQDGSSESEDSSQREVSSYKTVRALISLVSSNSSIISDPRKCEGFLRDACFNSREVFILVTAVKAVAVQRISEIEKTAIPTMSLDLEIRMLHENYGIDQQAARWAIESWAIALGKLEADRNKSPVTKPEDITNECNRLLLKGA